jgi:NADH:ubiquinone oxidoreductase subunit 3 (subunit A)
MMFFHNAHRILYIIGGAILLLIVIVGIVIAVIVHKKQKNDSETDESHDYSMSIKDRPDSAQDLSPKYCIVVVLFALLKKKVNVISKNAAQITDVLI